MNRHTACKSCFEVFRFSFERGPACARCQKRNTCKECMVKVLLTTLGEKKIKSVCADCRDAYAMMCQQIKTRHGSNPMPELKFIPTQGSEAKAKSFERLEKLQGKAHEDSKSPAFPFARALIPSAIAAYGRPVIDSHEDESPCSITFEWQHMFWLFDKNGDRLTVVINDNPKDALEFCRKNLKSFIADHQCIPTGMATLGDQSEFKNQPL